MTTAGLASRYSAVYTGAITDVLDRMGRLKQRFPPSIRPLRPGMRVAGPVYTVEGRPQPGADYDTSLRATLEMLGAVPAGHVAVYQTHGEGSAHLGELSVTSLKARGCAGAVIDGGCRDIEFILREDHPVFSRHVTPQDCTHRWQMTGHGEVTIDIGGVLITPGDWIVGDDDGVVVIPGDVVADVLEVPEAMVRTESEIRDAVRGGVTPLEAYERYGTF